MQQKIPEAFSKIIFTFAAGTFEGARFDAYALSSLFKNRDLHTLMNFRATLRILDGDKLRYVDNATFAKLMEYANYTHSDTNQNSQQNTQQAIAIKEVCSRSRYNFYKDVQEEQKEIERDVKYFSCFKF